MKAVPTWVEDGASDVMVVRGAGLANGGWQGLGD